MNTAQRPRPSGHDRVKDIEHQDRLLATQIDNALSELRYYNRAHFRPAEINDIRAHFRATGQLPEFLRMINEEIVIVRKHGPRPAPWWDSLEDI